MQREFLLFSDCLLWLAPVESSAHSWDWDWSWSGSGNGSGGISHSIQNSPAATESKTSTNETVPMIRTRSKSEAEISSLKDDLNSVDSPPVTPQKSDRRKSHHHAGLPPPPPNMVKRHGSTDDKFVYKGRVELVDLEVVVGSALEDERRFEVLSPEGSFVAYAGEAAGLFWCIPIFETDCCSTLSATEEERDDWTSEIRAAKAQLFVSLNATNPNSTLTSSASTNHIRRSLQALPFPPSDDRLATLRASSSLDVIGVSLSSNGKDKGRKKDKEQRGNSAERRRKVDHWVPAIWIPDGKTSSCMRCGRAFGWRRRRHHCRLCGRCVCATCSGRVSPSSPILKFRSLIIKLQTFFISDSNAKQDSSTKPARACDACYDTVFPVINPPLSEDFPSNTNNESHKSDTITSLSHLPSWLSMPSLPVQRQPHALMAIDMNFNHDVSFDNIDDIGSEAEERGRKGRVRVKSHQRIRSYQQLLEDFQEQSHAVQPLEQDLSSKASRSQVRNTAGMDDIFDIEDEEEDQDHVDPFYTPTHSIVSSPVSSPRKQQRREDTARRSKRFSLPAIGLHTTIVTARTSIEADELPATEGVRVGEEGTVGEGVGGAVGGGLAKRFSLVLAGRHSHHVDVTGSKGRHDDGQDDSVDLGLAKGLAATRLSELLGRKSTPKT